MYTVTFTDDTRFQGGEPNKSHWNDIPNKPITKIEYQIGNQNIVLQGYEAYNHLFERSLGINKLLYIPKIYLMAKKGNDVLILIYDIKRNKLDYDAQSFGKEYNNKSTTGWKEGVKNDKPKSIIN